MVKSAYSFAIKKEKVENYIIVVWVDNEAGVLARVVGLFSGRGTIATSGTPQVLQQIKLQLGKLIPVHKVADFPSNTKTLLREMALLKVVASDSQLKKAKKLCQKHKCRVLDKTAKSLVFEISAMKKEIDVLIKKLQPLGLASASRTGVVAMTKGSEVYKKI